MNAHTRIPVWSFIEQSTKGVNVDDLSVRQNRQVFVVSEQSDFKEAQGGTTSIHICSLLFHSHRTCMLDYVFKLNFSFTHTHTHWLTLHTNTCVHACTHIPVWLPVEESTWGVNVDDLSVNNGAVALLGVLLGGITEEPTADGLLDSGCVLSTRHHVQLVPNTWIFFFFKWIWNNALILQNTENWLCYITNQALSGLYGQKDHQENKHVLHQNRLIFWYMYFTCKTQSNRGVTAWYIYYTCKTQNIKMINLLLVYFWSILLSTAKTF